MSAIEARPTGSRNSCHCRLPNTTQEPRNIIPAYGGGGAGPPAAAAGGLIWMWLQVWPTLKRELPGPAKLLGAADDTGLMTDFFQH